MRQTLDRGVLIGLGLVAALLIVIPVLNHRNTNQLNEDAGWVAHTHEVLGMTADVLLALVDAETGERGFIITGKDEFLQPYNTSLARLDENLAKLKEKTKDNSRQQDNIRKLVAMTTNRLALLEEGIALRRKGVQEAQAFIAAKKGKEQMDAIRELVGEMKREETDLLKERQGWSSLAYQTALTTGLLSALLSMGLFGVFVWLLRRSFMARQNATAVLHEQREWFHTTLASIGDAVIATDIEGHVAFLNSVGESLTGWKEEDAKGQPLEVVFRIVNEDTRQPVENPALRALKQGQIVGLANHTVLIARDGTERSIDDSAAPIRNAAGTITGSVLVFRDISSRRLEELARQERERFIQRILDASPGVVYIYDLEERRTVFINQRVGPTLGVSADQVMEAGERFMAERVHPDDMPRLQDHLQGFATVTNGEVVATEYRMRHSEGKWHWFASRDVVFTRTPEGKPKQALGVATDMSDRKQLEEDIRRQHDVLTMAEAAARIGHFEWSIPDDDSWWSPEMEALYGLPPGGYEGGIAGWRKMVDPGDVARAEEDVRESLTTGRLQTEFRVVWSNGTIRWLEARAVVSTDSDGKPVRMVGINMDITERKQAEEALRDADRRKDEFLVTLAHELRNPLAPLLNGLHVMKVASGERDAVEQTRAMMERQLGQMVRLIDDLLDVSRIRQGKVEIRKERVELGAVIKTAVETSRPMIEGRGHDLMINGPPDPIYVDADPIQLAQVFTNLLNNAAKYTEKGGHVTLAVERQGSDAVVSVRDSGVGIPPDMLSKIFDIYTQVEGNREKSQDGLGIGLALVKGLVELQGGSVEARSEGTGMGSEFVVRLPVVLSLITKQRSHSPGPSPTLRP